jgi:hypothetical protein
MLRTSLVIACGVLIGCPGDSGDGSSSTQGGGMQSGAGANSQESTRLCDAHLAWDMGCAALEPEPREEPYWGATTCLMGPWHHVQSAYLEAAVDCFESLPCEESDDSCTGAGLAALGIEDEEDLADDARYQQCVALAADCQDLSEDACLSFAIYTPSSRSAAQACLDLACDAVEACLQEPS